MQFGDAVGAVLDYAGQGAGGAFEDHVRVLMNGVYRRVLDKGRVPNEEREFTLTTEEDTSQYGMPLYVRRVLNIEDPDTPRFVFVTTPRAFDKNYPGTTESGTPSMAYIMGVRGVQKQPASDGVLSLSSDSTVDAGSNYQVRVTGFNTAGVLVTEMVTLTGTTAVETSNSYDSTLGVERVVKAPASGFSFSGNVTVADSEDNTLSVIPVWWESPDYEWVEFHPIPDAEISYVVRAEMRKPPLVNDTDWPEFSEEYHMLLVFGVTMDLLPGLGMVEQADRHRDSFDELLKQMQESNQRRPANVLQFRDVQSMGGVRQRPLRPLILGVDFGLVSE